MSSASLAKRVSSALTAETLDLGELYPALRTYCPILYPDEYGSPCIHDHPQQCVFLCSTEREGFYGGAAGGGNSAALLMGALQYVDVPGYAALILRKSFPQLSQPGMLIPLSRSWLTGHKGVSWNEQLKQWTFPSGAVIKFGHVQDEQAIYDYQGGAYHYIGFDELTQFTEYAYEYIAFSRSRRDMQMRDLGVPIRTRATSNPGGTGHAWVKKLFIDHRAT